MANVMKEKTEVQVRKILLYLTACDCDNLDRNHLFLSEYYN